MGPGRDPLFFIVARVSWTKRQNTPFATAHPEGLEEPRLIADNGLAQRIGRVIEPTLGDFGLRLVRVKISAARSADRPDHGRAPGRDDGNRGLRAGEHRVVPGARRRGSHQPRVPARSFLAGNRSTGFVRESDFRRAIGHEARVEMAVPVGGRKRFRGVIEALGAIDGALPRQAAAAGRTKGCRSRRRASRPGHGRGAPRAHGAE